MKIFFAAYLIRFWRHVTGVRAILRPGGWEWGMIIAVRAI